MIVNNVVISFYKSNNKYKIEIRDINSNNETTPSAQLQQVEQAWAVKTFEYESDVDADEGSLVVVDNVVYIAPHNKQLNLIDGEWSLNDFVSTSPSLIISANNTDNGFIYANGYIKIDAPATKNYSSSYFVIGALYQSFTINDGDTVADIVEAIRAAAVGNSSMNSIYNITSDGSYVIFKYKYPNQLQEQVVRVSYPFSETKNVNGGTNTETGTLEQSTDYWYKARFVFYDGHITKTSFPVKVKTSNFRRKNYLEIPMVRDLDGRYAVVEVFRKSNGTDFFLIDRVRPTETEANDIFFFIDDGKTPTALLNEQQYVWSTKHLAQDAVRDRYVRANIEYRNYSAEAEYSCTIVEQAVTEENALPPNTNFEIFTKVKFEDGQESFHQKVFDGVMNSGFTKLSLGSASNQPIDFLSSSFNLRVSQDSLYSDAKEIGLYARYKKNSPEQEIKFSSIEFYNVNLPSVSTSQKTEAEQDKPLNPHVFLGWKYIARVLTPTGVGQGIYVDKIYDKDWDTDPEEKEDGNSILKDGFVVGAGNYSISSPNPDITQFEIIQGSPQTYYKKFSYENTIIYELALVEQLKEALASDPIKIKLTSTSNLLSSELTNSEYIDREVDVIGVEDKSEESAVEYNRYGRFISPPKNNKVYLVLAAGTVFDKINSVALIKNDLKGNYDIGYVPPRLSSMEFSLPGFESLYVSTNDSSFTDENSVVNFYWDYVLINNLTDVSDALVYLGKKENEVSSLILTHTGYKRTRVGNYIYFSLDSNNIYESLIREEDLITVKNKFPNQIIWSEPYSASNNSGTRNFSSLNFLNMPTDYGQIIKIVYTKSMLIVFFDRGVMGVNVGEVLTQSTADQTLVASTNFLNSPQWILRNTRKISPRSIVKFQDMVFFADEKDVWMFGDGLKIVSSNTVPIAYGAIGSVDSKNNEYRISSNGQTWALSLDSLEWFGPYTFVDTVSNIFSDRVFSINDNKMVEHNIGNYFAGEEYETIIESVGNDLGDSSIEKLFRKFYMIVTNDGTFSYTKDRETWKDVDLSEQRKINNVTHVGVAEHNKTATKLYWKLKSTAENFVLKLMSFDWTARQRR